MKFRVSCHLDYEIQPPATLLYNVRVRPSRSLVVLEERLELTPNIGSELIVTEPDCNRFDRVRFAEGTQLILKYEATVEAACQFLTAESLRKVAPGNLAPANLPFLLPSRYCQSDLLARFAWQKFGQIGDAYDQVLEITKWIYENVEYTLGSTTAVTSAYDTVTQCAGVCRDFAHLGIALCRALTIPARYFCGYAYRLEPPDFHACFEAFIGGYWILFDATHLASPNGLVRIGSGRDAADVSLCTAFGFASPKEQRVECEVLSNDYQPLTEEQLRTTAISLDVPAL
ncbi:transglutaminase family protein [soil metagenome]